MVEFWVLQLQNLRASDSAMTHTGRPRVGDGQSREASELDAQRVPGIVSGSVEIGGRQGNGSAALITPEDASGRQRLGLVLIGGLGRAKGDGTNHKNRRNGPGQAIGKDHTED